MQSHNRPLIIRLYQYLWFTLCSAVLVSACDTLESDSLVNQPEIQLKDEPIVLIPQNSGVIDLNTLVESATGNHTFSITREPVLGELESIGEFLLRYTPHEEVTEGKDSFVVSILGNERVIVARDTIIIIITPDSTSIPCGLYAMNDIVDLGEERAPVYIDVAGNDILCGIDSTDIIVTLLEDEVSDTAVAPLFGTAEVLADGRIRYTPGSNFTSGDSFMYRITRPENDGNATETSIGSVYITSSPVCPTVLVVLNDTFSISFEHVVVIDSITFDTLYHFGPYTLDVRANDFWCSRDQGSIEIIVQPSGQAEVSQDTLAISYTLPPNVWPGYEDFLRYRLCAGGKCGEADVTIRVE